MESTRFMVSSQFSHARFRTTSLDKNPGRLASNSSADTSNPWILDTLLQNFDYDLEQVAGAIDPILTAQNHCRRSEWYLQGIIIQDRGFLSTNINQQQAIQVTSCGTRWLLGHSQHCTISVPEQGVALCHAALSFEPGLGFCITDLSSQGGTRVNGQPLPSMEPYVLQEGDLIEVGSTHLEFFQELCPDPTYSDEFDYCDR